MKASSFTAAALAASLIVSGCAANQGYGAGFTPVVDVRADQQARYQTDLSECQAYATQVATAGQGAAAGALAGALFGALLGAAAGGNSRMNTQVAGAGLVTGAASGGAAAEGGQRNIIRRCLAGRGYNVLN